MGFLVEESETSSEILGVYSLFPISSCFKLSCLISISGSAGDSTGPLVASSFGLAFYDSCFISSERIAGFSFYFFITSVG